jgi:hypothetical protein
MYLGESAEKNKDKSYSFTLNQFDSSTGFEIIKSKKLGAGHFVNKVYSPSGDYLVVYLAKERNESGELIVYSAGDLNELFRVDVYIPSNSNRNQLEVLFNQDESVIILPVIHFNKKRKINAYSINDSKLLYSYPLPKKGYLIGQSMSQDTFYIGVKYKPRGYSSIDVIDIKTGKILNRLEKKRTRYNYMGHVRGGLFVSSYEKTRKHYEYELITLDNDSGMFKLSKQIGRIKPVFTAMNQGKNIYFLNKDEKSKALQINQLVDDKVVKLAHLQSILKPSFLAVNKQIDKFFVAGEKSYVLVDGTKKTSSDRIHRPFDIVSGFFAKDDSLIYLRQTIGQGNSKVAVIDFDQAKTINISGSGSKVAKFENLVASVASAAVSGYLTGYMYVNYRAAETKMLLDNDENKLYVLNSKTKDLTIFDARDLSGRHSITIGLGAIGVFQIGSNIFVLGKNRISYFNQSYFEKIKEIKFKKLLNFDIEEDLLFLKNREGDVNVYKLSTGEIVGSLDNAKNLEKIDFLTPLKK